MNKTTQEKIKAIKDLYLESTQIISATAETNYSAENSETLPPFVRVELVSKPAESSYIRHELWLPLVWNGIFLGMGNGGLAGIIRYDRLAFGVKNGCATANTDLGTSDGRIRGTKNPEVHKDFGWRATYLMTEVGKQITECFYGTPISHSYFIGRSTGGQQALMLATRYPKAYEGIVAGVPGNDRTHLHTYFLWNYNKMHRRDGTSLFTRDEIHSITDKAISYCHEKGVVKQGKQFISLPPTDKDFLCGFVNTLALTMEQKSALMDIYTGPVDPKTGQQIHSGMPVGSECTTCGMADMLGKESPYFYPFIWTFGGDYKGSSFDFSGDMETVDAALSENLNVNNADLTEFFSYGGKLLMYSGSADACVPFHGAVNYFKKVCRVCPQQADAQLRYFILPGQDHEAEIYLYGTAVMNGSIAVSNNLQIIRKWHEEGIAPECFNVVTRNGDEQIVETVHKMVYTG